MIYTDFFVKKQIRIPTLLSLPLILLVTYLLSRFVLTPVKTIKATKQNVKGVQVANLFSNQATIIWQTDKKEEGWLIYADNKTNLLNLTIDQRDSPEKRGLYLNHYVGLKNLKEDTTYYFRIASRDGLAEKQNNLPFSFKTLKKTSSVGSLKPAYGRVVDKKGSNLENALVVLVIDNSLPLATLSKSSGEWLIPLNFIFDSQTREFEVVSEDNKAKIEFLSEEGEKSTVETRISNLNPLRQTIVMGKDYSLTFEEEVLGTTAQNTNQRAKVEIIFPKANAIVPDNRPLVKGTAAPNTKLQVSVTDGKSKTLSKIQADKDGQWRMSVPTALAVGKHTLEVIVKGSDGNDIVERRIFTIAKSGEQVLGEATDEPTPQITQLTPTQTPTPTPQTISQATPTPQPPVSGSSFFYLTLTSITFIALGLGLFFISFL